VLSVGAALTWVGVTRADTRWPPVLTGLVVLVVVGGITVVVVMFRSFRGAARAARLRPRGDRR